MRLSVREVQDRTPGRASGLRCVREWICPECDYFEEVDAGKDNGRAQRAPSVSSSSLRTSSSKSAKFSAVSHSSHSTSITAGRPSSFASTRESSQLDDVHLQGLDQKVPVVPAARTGQGHLSCAPLGPTGPLSNLRIVRERLSHTQSRSSGHREGIRSRMAERHAEIERTGGRTGCLDRRLDGSPGLGDAVGQRGTKRMNAQGLRASAPTQPIRRFLVLVELLGVAETQNLTAGVPRQDAVRALWLRATRPRRPRDARGRRPPRTRTAGLRALRARTPSVSSASRSSAHPAGTAIPHLPSLGGQCNPDASYWLRQSVAPFGSCSRRKHVAIISVAAEAVGTANADPTDTCRRQQRG